MKKIIYIISGLALGMGLGSCAKETASEIATPEIPDVNNTFVIGGQFTANTSDSRAALDEMLSFSWTENDSIYFYMDLNVSNNSGAGTTFNATPQANQVSVFKLTEGEGTKSAQFEAQSTTMVVDSAYNSLRRFYATYPYNKSGSGTALAAMNNSTGQCTFDLQRVQTQDGVSDPAGLGKNLLMWADPIDDAEGLLEKGIYFHFRHLCSVLGFNIKNLPQGVKVSSVMIQEYNPETLEPGTTQIAYQAGFLLRTNLKRVTAKGSYVYGDVTGNSYYQNSMTVNMKEPIGDVDFTVRLSVLPLDFMTQDASTIDTPGSILLNAASQGPDARRHLRIVVSVLTADDVTTDTYTFYTRDTNGELTTTKTYWKPGFYYYRDLDFDGIIPDSQLTDPDLDPIDP